MKKGIWIVVCLFFMVCSGCKEASKTYFEEATEETETTELAGNTKTAEFADATDGTVNVVDEKGEKPDLSTNAICYVYVCGAVNHPGVYQLKSGSRIYEAVICAGGLTKDACEESINQAEEITDGQMIKVLTKDEAAQMNAPAESKDESDGRVNLNTADVNALMTLPGIGESKAMSILSYREEHGNFSSVEELMNIPGIKNGVYSKIKDYITVN